MHLRKDFRNAPHVLRANIATTLSTARFVLRGRFLLILDAACVIIAHEATSQGLLGSRNAQAAPQDLIAMMAFLNAKVASLDIMAQKTL